MSLLREQNVLLGITAGIAAYKSAWLVRLLVKQGANVQVVLTPSAKEFVTPLTLSTLSKNPVLSHFTDEKDENAVWNNHVDLGLWADFIIIAPATANTMSKMTNGICDNLLLAVYLSAKCPVYFAPAMDLDMYKHDSTRHNLIELQKRGNVMIPAEHGELASGLVGEGRMAEPESIVAFIEAHIKEGLPLKGKKVLVTAGPTYEAIDPVRFIGNHSSGKMGFEIAKAASKMGAEVVLISGPSNESIEGYSIEKISVVSAEEMYNAVHGHFDQCHVAVLSAAVADYRPEKTESEKIKKTDSSLGLKLVKTEDILKSIGDLKRHQYLVGFALETSNEIENAKSKLERKNLDLIVLNSLKDTGAGFGGSTNKVTFISASGAIKVGELKSKREVASDLMDLILKNINA
ncbi:bifunctional phosphopantothenoylcysteine decarboxylase/phosphopantothenate--cysteine ligase CoaBC [Winogradskyella aurantiaca]|uniref:bifunctional phosphopantothenoylcysteine decarboxylase/phosphopantothenate--cysteine ligase CoaBC n=1 Tax=Winogradskyella aurantiaca TaxID=2219558 RepID=UPI000E1C829F|nr:bifunctional phosphopantothenoylcysteine decarboxylase/phosphopantothenate--cysteine ligase CoaBC [Winogradskyella aurantiaca]